MSAAKTAFQAVNIGKANFGLIEHHRDPREFFRAWTECAGACDICTNPVKS